MTITRIGLLVVALAFATSSACKERSSERQAIARLGQTPPLAAELHVIGTEQLPHSSGKARVPLEAGIERAPLEVSPEAVAAPAPGDAKVTKVFELDEALPAGDLYTRGPEALPRDRQHAPTEAEVRRTINQIQTRMNDELARARNIIVELQRANAELRQTLANERQQLAELYKRLTSGRSIALQ